ncbi:MAG TPA: hypothetical protein VHA70_10470 [Bauldia sp.]|nr:hypothetical protein [Bauldia sp.]
MLAALAGWVLRLASSGLLDKTLAALQARAESGVEHERIEASVAVEQVRAELARRQAQRDVLLAEQGRLVTSLMRPAFAYPLAAYYAAVIADSLGHFRWNVAALPPPIGDWSGWIISAIFLSESGERITRILAGRRA